MANQAEVAEASHADMDDRPFTVEEVAERERVSERTVRNWCMSGLVPAYKAGRQWRVERHYRQELRDQSL
jgi:excisionase family DNA binding protein